MKPIRIVQWGFGAMGSGMVKLMLEKEGMEIVGVIRRRPDTIDKVHGAKIYGSPEDILDKDKVDLVVHATDSFTKNVFDELKLIMDKGINVVTIAEEMACPHASEPELADKLDAIAKENGVTILGTGVNPGFVLDQLIINLSGACHTVTKIEASRINDLSPFGHTVMQTQGVGTTPEEFAAGIEDGSIVGHIGFKESIRMMSDAIGLEIDEIKETREPIISNTERETPVVKVKPGLVAGCRHIGIGYRKGEEIIKLIHPQQIHPEVENIDTGDYIKIEGVPGINMSIKPEIPGGIGTMSVAVNMIPIVMKATPGLKRMFDLPIPACIMGKTAYDRWM